MVGFRIKVFSCKTIGGVGRCGDVDVENSLVEEGTYESGTGPTIMGIRTVTEAPGAFPPVVGCAEAESSDMGCWGACGG